MKLLYYVLSLCLGALAFTVPVEVMAVEPSVDDCSKELLLSYFPEPFVSATLKKFKVPEKEWAGIVAELKQQDKEVIKLVESKAAAMNPNPLRDPSDRQMAVKLFRETLIGVFSTVLKQHDIQDARQIQAMLDDIQQQKARKFAACMKKSNFLNENEEDDKAEKEEKKEEDKNVSSTLTAPAGNKKL
ncbi:hypothetical protein [Parachlamydia sp. AcF125]|uniref:hypothetical protein n=1 Tax=Parachlamydia sp. AcF125 TaxID=2795736 RepID=UPI001BC9055D|nr:hypothetical protein [Parachlamydia sp. AcF125]MBS4168816.1 hypothetical protein [Parachlamydia sp. AcF125]